MCELAAAKHYHDFSQGKYGPMPEQFSEFVSALLARYD